MKLSITKAADLANVSRTTLYNDMHNGKLTYETDAKDKKVIDISELERVYGPLRMPQAEGLSSFAKADQVPAAKSVNIEVELAVLRERLLTMETERGREREQLSSEVEHLRKRLEIAEQERTKLTAMITDQREGRGDQNLAYQKKLDVLEQTMQKLGAQNRRIYLELQGAKNKSIWKRVFGSAKRQG
jgi:adenylate kinase family enzyme